MKFYRGEGILAPTATEKGNFLGLHNLIHKALAKNASMLLQYLVAGRLFGGIKFVWMRWEYRCASYYLQ